jgi:anti-anti-sigma factor
VLDSPGPYSSDGSDSAGTCSILLEDAPPDVPDVRIVRVRGELNSRTAVRLGAVIQNQLWAWPRLVVVDLTHLTSLGTDSVAVLVAAAVDAREKDIGFRLVGAEREVVSGPLRTAGCLDLFEIHDSLDAALEALT